jgi:sulfide:quinone oxidoreductase
MQTRPVDNQFNACGQISAADFKALAAKGFKSAIQCRPDGEGGASQPASSELRQAAAAAGMAFAYIPVGGGHPDGRAAMSSALAKLPKPIVGFCLSGMRASNLYAQAK